MKKKLTLTKVMLLLAMAILPMTFYAQGHQSKPVEKYFYISAEGGLSINHTDLANYGGVPFYQDGKFMIDNYLFHNFDGGLSLGYQLGKVIGLNGKFLTGTLSGEKHGQELTPITLQGPLYDLQLDKTTFMEANLNLTFNLSNLFFGYNPRRVFNFIPHVGIGGIRYHAGAVNQISPIVAENGQGGTTQLLAAKENDPEMTFTIPVGAELNFNVAPKLDIYVDYTFTFAGNDKLDQTTKYVDDIQVINDMYSHVNLGLRYKFNNPCDIEGMANRANEIKMWAEPDPLEEKDGKVCFKVNFEVPGGYFEKQAVMNVTPTLNYKGGSLDLAPVTFVGEKVKGNGDFVVNYKNGGTYSKDYCIDYQPAMETSTLNGTPMFYVYNGTIYPTQEDIVKNTYFTQGGERKLADGVHVPVPPTCEATNVNVEVKENTITLKWNGNAKSYDVYIAKEGTPDATTEPVAAGLTAKTYTFTDLEDGDYVVYVKAHCANGLDGEWQGVNASIIPEVKPIAIYYFDKNKSEILGYGRDVRDRNKTARKQFNGIEGAGFRIEAWASPEGELDRNNNLADNRADAAVKDIKAQLKKNAKNFEFTANGNGPDWDKFIELVKVSNIKDKDQIVRVIENSHNREQEIKNMINVYPELERDILPLIRRAEVYLK